MSELLVGILGCGGRVGAIATEILSRRFRVRGGQRSPPTTRFGSNFEWRRVDILNEASLDAFCDGCSIILNCAGPSYVVAPRIAAAAAKAHCGYVDIFGDEASAKPSAGATDMGSAVIGAGVWPGLSGALPLWLASEEFEVVHSVSGYAGGLEHCSFGAAADLLLSSVHGFGVPDAYWRGGRILPCLSDGPEDMSVPGFSGTVYVKPFVSRETTRLAHKMGLEEARWHNVTTRREVARALLESSSQLAMGATGSALEGAAGRLVACVESAVAGQTPWYTMTVDARGVADGIEILKRVVIKSNSSYAISATVGALAVESMLRDGIRPGVHWAFEILDPQIVIQALRRNQATTSFELATVPVRSKTEGRFPGAPEPLEEGAL